MECENCKFGEFDWVYCCGYTCRNPEAGSYGKYNRMEGFGCTLGEPRVKSAAPTSIFTEPQKEEVVSDKLESKID